MWSLKKEERKGRGETIKGRRKSGKSLSTMVLPARQTWGEHCAPHAGPSLPLHALHPTSADLNGVSQKSHVYLEPECDQVEMKPQWIRVGSNLI